MSINQQQCSNCTHSKATAIENIYTCDEPNKWKSRADLTTGDYYCPYHELDMNKKKQKTGKI